MIRDQFRHTRKPWKKEPYISVSSAHSETVAVFSPPAVTQPLNCVYTCPPIF